MKSPTVALSRFGWLLILGLLALALLTHARDALSHNKHEDLFIYRAGANLGLQGRTPYDTVAVRELVVEQYPTNIQLAENLGFFLPPQAIVIFAPFVALPWESARWLYAILSIGLLGFAGSRLSRLATVRASSYLPLILVLVLLFNPVVMTGMIVGQTSALVLACILLGELAQRSSWSWLAGFLWAVAFIKPHLALPLLPLSLVLGGWPRLVRLLVWLLALNLAGCLISSGTPFLFRDYLEYLSANHGAVAFNRVATNPHITSWNRLIVAVGGPAIELSASGVLAGYTIWALLVLGRVRMARERPPSTWLLAASVPVAPVVCQVMGYELTLLALVIPLVIDRLRMGSPGIAFLILTGLVLAWAPFEVGTAFPAHRAFGALWVLVVVLVAGWPKAPFEHAVDDQPSSIPQMGGPLLRSSSHNE